VATTKRKYRKKTITANHVIECVEGKGM